MDSEVTLGRGFDYILVRRGQMPFFGCTRRYERVDTRQAEALVVRAILEDTCAPDWSLLHFLNIDEHPLNLDEDELQGIVLQQLRRLGHELYQRVPWPMVPSSSEWSGTLPAAALPDRLEPAHYIALELVNEVGAAIPSVLLAVELADGEVRSVHLGALGAARIAPVPGGQCTIKLPARA
jgi:hypothetical protein